MKATENRSKLLGTCAAACFTLLWLAGFVGAQDAVSTNQTEATESTLPPAPALSPEPTPALTPAPTESAVAPKKPLAYIIPVRDAIDKNALSHFRLGIPKAQEAGADLIVIAMDTHGGGVFETEEITRLIMELDIPIFTFVEYNAISAGAMIAICTDKIYMKAGSKIGDAIIIMSGPKGMEPVPETEREKLEGFGDALIRTLAEHSGRDPKLASCMIRPDLEYKIGDEVICEKGRILTLTNNEAAKLYGEGEDQKPLLSEATVGSIEDMLAQEGYEGAQLVEMEFNWAELTGLTLTKYSPLLLTIGSLGLLIMVYNPSLTVPGLIIAVVCYGVFFFGNYVEGFAGYEEVLIFVVGLILIALEIFVIPGFGVAGITGILCVLGALLAAMVNIDLPEGVYIPSFEQLSVLRKPLVTLSASILMTGLGALVMGMIIPNSRVFNRRMVLQKSASKAEGYDAMDDHSGLVKKTGVATTNLTPSGSALINEQLFDVMTQGEWIDSETPIQVMETHGNVIIVATATPPDVGTDA